jgi:hypothetical protein
MRLVGLVRLEARGTGSRVRVARAHMARAATAGGDGGSNLTRYCIQHASSSNSPGLAAVARTGIFATGFDAPGSPAAPARAVLCVSVCHGCGKRGVSRPSRGGASRELGSPAEAQGVAGPGSFPRGDKVCLGASFLQEASVCRVRDAPVRGPTGVLVWQLH